jgi:hypothetical protein
VSETSGATQRATKIEVRAATTTDGATWDAFVGAHPDGTHYHRFGWSRVIANAFGQRIHYRLATAGDAIVGVLPIVGFSSPLFGRYLISVPFLNRGGILAANDAARDALVADARTLLASTRSDFVELRHVRGIDPSLPA